MCTSAAVAVVAPRSTARASLGSVAVHPTRPAEQLDDPEVAASPFRAAFGRARLEAFTATGSTP